MAQVAAWKYSWKVLKKETKNYFKTIERLKYLLFKQRKLKKVLVQNYNILNALKIVNCLPNVSEA